MVTGDHLFMGVAIAKQVRRCVSPAISISDNIHQVGILTNEKIDTLNEMHSLAFTFVHVPPTTIKLDNEGPVRSVVLAGDDIASFDRHDWNMLIRNYTEVVFACTTPKQKLRIVEEAKAQGDNIVAVTGDGVNDAPALKASDIRVAMGSGSNVAKEAGAYTCASILQILSVFLCLPSRDDIDGQ
jgi:sodium/potassium-transporting ATPase subunit alpha